MGAPHKYLLCIFPAMYPGTHYITSLCPSCQLEIILLISIYVYQALIIHQELSFTD